ncbi:MAG: AAA family ATPase [Planctomycetia bacterium]
MRSIAVMNQKGGVGKTTTTVNVAAALAARGHRVMVVDLDPQAHATFHLGLEPTPDDPTVYDLLVGDATLAEVRHEVQTASESTLKLIGSHLDLAAAELELTGVIGRETILRNKLATDPEPLDYLLIDCPPSLGILTINALAAVDEVLIPLQPHFLALHGLSRLLETIGLISERINNRLRLTGVVLCMYDAGTRLAAEVSQDVEAFFEQARDTNQPWSGAKTFTTRIRRNIRLAEAPSFGQSIFEYAPKSNGAEDYLALATELAGSVLREPNPGEA